MPLIDHAAHYLGMSLHIAALHEESTLDVIVAQDVQHPGVSVPWGPSSKVRATTLSGTATRLTVTPECAGKEEYYYRTGLRKAPERTWEAISRPAGPAFPGAVTGEMVVFTGEPDSAGCSWCWEQADMPNARAHARNKCFFITGFWRIYAHPPSCHVLNHPSVRHEKESAPCPGKNNPKAPRGMEREPEGYSGLSISM